LGSLDEFFNDLHVLSTQMPKLPHDYLLQIDKSRLKENIRNEIKLIDIKDIDQAQLKARIVEKN
jgi:hypothetical protein